MVTVYRYLKLYMFKCMLHVDPFLCSLIFISFKILRMSFIIKIMASISCYACSCIFSSLLYVKKVKQILNQINHIVTFQCRSLNV